jgi:predicted nucleotidyltransferase component of viral defense system
MSSNPAELVRKQLTRIARETGRPFADVLRYYGMERFLYRLSVSPYGDRFVLKGALMLQIWQGESARPTFDVDLLGRIENSVAKTRETLRTVCQQEAEPDGVEFDPDTLRVQTIIEDAIYQGLRASFVGYLGKSRIPMRVDIGFGDVVIGASPDRQPYPTMLDAPAPALLGYSRESVIAEKLQVMAKLGLANSRVKDYYDIWSLSRQFDFDGQLLAEAVRRTFAQRDTEVPRQLDGLTNAYPAQQDRAQQWTRFVERNELTHAPVELAQVMPYLRQFIGALVEALAEGDDFRSFWHAPGPWTPK